MARLRGKPFTVASREDRPTTTRPNAPFITSTLQQAASTRLSFSVKKTMMMAQRLYEAGYITYMRTDSTNLSSDAVASVREYIGKQFGAQYLPEQPNYLREQSRGAGSARSDSSVERGHRADRARRHGERCGTSVRNDLASVRRVSDAAGRIHEHDGRSRKPATSKRASAAASCVSTASRACCRRSRARTRIARCRISSRAKRSPSKRSSRFSTSRSRRRDTARRASCANSRNAASAGRRRMRRSSRRFRNAAT